MSHVERQRAKIAAAAQVAIAGHQQGLKSAGSGLLSRGGNDA
jgi:hypothetical protein